MTKRETQRTEFGERIRTARERVGLTQIPAAKAIGIGQSALAELEKVGKGSSHVTTMARVYRCDPHWLATGEGDPRFDQQGPEDHAPHATGDEHGSETDWAMFDAFRDMSNDDREELLKIALERAERHRRLTAEVLSKVAGKTVAAKHFEPTERVPGKAGYRYIRSRPVAKKVAAKKAPKGAA